MPIVSMAHNYQEAIERGSNVHLYRDNHVNRTLVLYSDGVPMLNLNPSIPLEEQGQGYEYSPLIWLYENYHGLCLYEREYNGYNDSDFYMVVWNPETQKTESHEFASTRGWSYPCYASHADATPEVLAAYEQFKRDQEAKADAARAEQIRRTPAKGKTLKVVRGRKVKIGTTGICFWLGNSNFGQRVGIKDSDGTVYWTSIKNVEVI